MELAMKTFNFSEPEESNNNNNGETKMNYFDLDNFLVAGQWKRVEPKVTLPYTSTNKQDSFVSLPPLLVEYFECPWDYDLPKEDTE